MIIKPKDITIGYDMYEEMECLSLNDVKGKISLTKELVRGVMSPVFGGSITGWTSNTEIDYIRAYVCGIELEVDVVKEDNKLYIKIY